MSNHINISYTNLEIQKFKLNYKFYLHVYVALVAAYISQYFEK